MQDLQSVRVFAICPSDSDLVILSNLISHSAWSLESAATIRDAARALRSEQYPVVLCESRLPDGDWKKVLEMTSNWEIPPKVIVLSRTADQRLWAEVLSLGAWDILVKPYQAQEVYRSVHLAWRHWQDSSRIRMRRMAAGSERLQSTQKAFRVS